MYMNTILRETQIFENTNTVAVIHDFQGGG